MKKKKAPNKFDGLVERLRSEFSKIPNFNLVSEDGTAGYTFNIITFRLAEITSYKDLICNHFIPASNKAIFNAKSDFQASKYKTLLKQELDLSETLYDTIRLAYVGLFHKLENYINDIIKIPDLIFGDLYQTDGTTINWAKEKYGFDIKDWRQFYITNKINWICNCVKHKDGFPIKEPKPIAMEYLDVTKRIKISPEEFKSDCDSLIKFYPLYLQTLFIFAQHRYLTEKPILKEDYALSGQIKRKEKYTKKEIRFEKSKVRWRGNVIYDMLRNEIYKGLRIWRRHEDKVEIVENKIKKKKIVVEEVTAQVPEIIDAELWDKVNKNLQNNKKNVGKKAQYKYLLNELITCADCERDFVGKKRLANGDNAYKCKGKIYPHPDCKTSRGISINKLDSFIIKHLFFSKSLKQHLQNLPENNKTKNDLVQRLTNEEAILRKRKIELEVGYKRLLNPEFEKDKHIESHVLSLRNTVDMQQALVDDLANKVTLMEQNVRRKRTKELIGSYVDGIKFEDIKQLVHSLIDSIKIKHHKLDGKMGSFIVQIKYKGYNEISTFLTNWQANKWLWLSNYREDAYTEEQVIEDKEDTLELLKFYGLKVTKKVIKDFKKATGYSDLEINKMNPLSDNFTGLHVSSGLKESIELLDNEIVYFD